jgi:uncharacterized protein
MPIAWPGTDVRKLGPADFCVMPWKNGGGTTTQLMLEPAGADMDNFGWRVSMARVASDGPFSVFPGVDRSLAIMEGAGLRIEMQDKPAIALRPASPVLRFAGETPIHATLADGPVTDFNIMTGRHAWTHALDRIRMQGNLALEGADDALIYCMDGQLLCNDLPFGAGEALHCGACRTLHFCAVQRADFFLVRLYQKGYFHG